MFRRILVIWLIVSILGYGVTLAADLHGEQYGESGFSTAEPEPAQDPHADTGCGHCSHGALHLLGLANGLTATPVILSHRFQAGYLASHLSPPLRRHLRPPITT
jgi:hypothetical protein